MPLYDFECLRCHHKFEMLQKVSDDNPEMCPKCDSFGNVQKLISPSNFVLKGDGWAADDYAKKSI